MPIRVQYNDGTGKAKYTAGTSKQQTYDTNAMLAGCAYCQAPCGFCSGEQPEYIDVAFADIIDCADCFAWTSSWHGKVTTPIATNLNGNTYRVPYVSAQCLYRYAASGTFGVVTAYTDSNCTTGIHVLTYDRIYIYVIYTSSTNFAISVYIYIAAVPGSFAHPFRSVTNGFTSYDCLDIDNKVADNDNVCGSLSPVNQIPCYDGTATIAIPSSGL